MPVWRIAVMCPLVLSVSSCTNSLTGLLNVPLNQAMVRGEAPVFAANPKTPGLALLEFRIATSIGQAATDNATICAGFVDRAAPIKASIHTPSALAAADEAALLARYDRLSPLSACKWDGTAYRDTTNGAAAIVFDFHDLKCERPNLCEAYAGHNRDRTVNGWSFYELRFDGYWKIRRKELDIILTGSDRGGMLG